MSNGLCLYDAVVKYCVNSAEQSLFSLIVDKSGPVRNCQN